MAKDGCGLGTILLAGEWRSQSFIRYLQDDLLNPCEVLANILEHSDDEKDQNDEVEESTIEGSYNKMTSDVTGATMGVILPSPMAE